ncbi:MAG TPA: hypothetical protein VM912_12015, partial [Terriglobales bacterium]|nr:hypothetical protein [Terriglobales bacterium]
TIPNEMSRAVEMYQKLGFVEIAPYRVNPIAGAKYLELDLKTWQANLARSASKWAEFETKVTLAGINRLTKILLAERFYSGYYSARTPTTWPERKPTYEYR